jgi:hypothetical protein
MEWYGSCKVVGYGGNMKINRAWAMPNSRTFDIDPINKLVGRYVEKSNTILDPFANKCRKYGAITNDIDPDCDTDYSMDAVEFLGSFDRDSADLVLYDPPYSPRQVSECYNSLGLTVNMETTQSSFWSKIKCAIASVSRSGGYVISLGWNSGGIGKSLGFDIVEILLVAHGGQHNDTIVTVERKVQGDLL